MDMLFRSKLPTGVTGNGFRIREIPIIFEDRHSGTSKMTKEIVREAFWLVLRLGFYNITHPRWGTVYAGTIGGFRPGVVQSRCYSPIPRSLISQLRGVYH